MEVGRRRTSECVLDLFGINLELQTDCSRGFSRAARYAWADT
jgi:hypothetical protein